MPVHYWREKTEQGKWVGRDTNASYPARPENIYLLKMLGGILGREKMFFHYSTIFPRLGENTQTDMFETSQPWKKQTSRCRSWLQGYKLVGQVQFMLLVIQKGG